MIVGCCHLHAGTDGDQRTVMTGVVARYGVCTSNPSFFGRRIDGKTFLGTKMGSAGAGLPSVVRAPDPEA